MKNNIYAFIIGGLVVALGFHVYFFYQVRKATIENTAVINQIIQYLESSSVKKVEK